MSSQLDGPTQDREGTGAVLSVSELGGSQRYGVLNEVGLWLWRPLDCPWCEDQAVSGPGMGSDPLL